MAIKIPIHGSLLISDSEGNLGTYSPMLINGYADDFGNRFRNPGTEEIANIGDTIVIKGIYPWVENNIAVITDASGHIHRLEADMTVTDITGDPLTGANPPTFASDGTNLIIADGGRMVYTDGTTTTLYVGDADAPTHVTHVVFYDSYIVAADANSGEFYWSDIGSLTTWNALNFATAESVPDTTLALLKGYQELIMLGTQSIERWRDVGSSPPFERLPGGVVDLFGLGAKYSCQYIAGQLFFIDSLGRVIAMTGNAHQNIGLPIQKGIDALTKISDAFSYHMEIGGNLFYGLTFPTDKITWWYDVRRNTWAQVGLWNAREYRFDPGIINCHAYMPNWNIHLVGDRRPTGKILKLSPDLYQDDGIEIRYIQQTGAYDGDVYPSKRTELTRIRAKRGVGATGSADPLLMLRHREGSGWSAERQFSMGVPGDRRPIIEFQMTDIFETQAVELSYTENTGMVITGIQSEVTATR